MFKHLHIPFEGKLWLVAAVGFFLIGWLKSLNLILLLAYFMLLIWLLNLWLAGRGLGRVEVRRRIGRPAFAGMPFEVEFEVHNPTENDFLGFWVEDLGPHHRLSHFQVKLGPGETVRWRRAVTVSQRCCYYFEPIRLVGGLPFGLVRRSIRVGPDELLPVFPKLGRLHLGRLRQFLRQAGASQGWSRSETRPQPLVASEFHGLRPYRAGDSPRWIHWRTSARRGELMVREFEQAWSADLVVVLEPWLPADPASDARQLLEDAISLAATLCWEWCRQPGQRLTLASAGFGPIVLQGNTGPDLADRLLECLAVQQGAASIDVDKLLERLSSTGGLSGPVVLISTRPAAPLADALAARLRRPVACVAGEALVHCDFYEAPRYETRPAAGTLTTEVLLLSVPGSAKPPSAHAEA